MVFFKHIKFSDWAGSLFCGDFVIWGKSQWVILLNSLLLERLRLGYEGLQIYGIQPFYQKIEWIGGGFALKGEPLPGKYNWIDNLYIRNYVDNGFIVATLFFAFLTFAAYVGWKRRDYLF